MTNEEALKKIVEKKKKIGELKKVSRQDLMDPSKPPEYYLTSKGKKELSIVWKDYKTQLRYIQKKKKAERKKRLDALRSYRWEIDKKPKTVPKEQVKRKKEKEKEKEKEELDISFNFDFFLPSEKELNEKVELFKIVYIGQFKPRATHPFIMTLFHIIIPEKYADLEQYELIKKHQLFELINFDEKSLTVFETNEEMEEFLKKYPLRPFSVDDHPRFRFDYVDITILNNSYAWPKTYELSIHRFHNRCELFNFRSETADECISISQKIISKLNTLYPFNLLHIDDDYMFASEILLYDHKLETNIPFRGHIFVDRSTLQLKFVPEYIIDSEGKPKKAEWWKRYRQVFFSQPHISNLEGHILSKIKFNFTSMMKRDTIILGSVLDDNVFKNITCEDYNLRKEQIEFYNKHRRFFIH